MTATTAPPLPIISENIPLALQKSKRFVGWRSEPRKDEPKPKKMPYSSKSDHQRKQASSTSPGHWVTLEDARKYADVAGLDGIMRAFDHADNLVGIDLDNCLDPEIVNPTVDDLAPWATEFVKRCDTYTEISPSGTGVKMWMYGTMPPFGHKKGDVEVYGSQAGKTGPCGRFFTMTGHQLPGTPSTVGYRPDAVLAIHREVFGDTPDLTITPDDPDRPIPALQNGDEDVIRLAAESPHNGEKFRRLWSGDTSAYAVDGNDGESEADCALCELLAYYGGPDPERIERLWLRSGLVREKTERADYRERTIRKALTGKTRFYGDSVQPTEAAGADAGVGPDHLDCPEANRLRRLLLDRDDLIENLQTCNATLSAKLTSRTEFLSNISNIIAKPNQELSPGEKVVAIGTLIEIHFRASASPYKLPDGTEGSYRTPSGRVRMTRTVIGMRTGYSPNQASKIARQIAERENAPYSWDTTREWKTQADGSEGWVTTIEVVPLTNGTADSLRAVATLGPLPGKPKHGGSPQAIEARERVRRGCEHADSPVMISGCCAECGEVLGDRRISAQEWELLEHQDGVSEKRHQTVVVRIKGHQVDVPDVPPVSLTDYAASRPSGPPAYCPAPDCRAMEFRPEPDGSYRCGKSGHDPRAYELAAVVGGEE